jgi:hypothetical protein
MGRRIFAFTDRSPRLGIKGTWPGLGADLAPCLLLALSGHTPSPTNVRFGGKAVRFWPSGHSGKKGRTEQLKARWVTEAVPRRLPNAFVRSNVSSVPFLASFLPASAPPPAWVEKEPQGLCF